jgi:hypothetical protein
MGAGGSKDSEGEVSEETNSPQEDSEVDKYLAVQELFKKENVSKGECCFC